MNRILWSGLFLLSLVFSNLSFRGSSASQVELPGMPPRGDYAAGDNTWYEHVRVTDVTDPLKPPVGDQIENMNGEPDPWNKIVMMSYRNENWEIYLAPSGSYGAPINRVTIYSRDDVNPSLNRGADTIIYSSYREGYYNLFSIKTDGSSQVRLTSHKANDDEPQWAPYGLEFAFVSDRDGNREIYKMIRDGNQQIRLTSHPNGDFSPIYSPDGSKIAWVRVVNSTQGQIMVMNLDGSNQQPMSPPINYLTDLAWSPKGDAISFSYIKDLSYPYYALGRYLIDTGQVEYLKGCGSSRDCRNGSYMSESQLIFTDMRWELIGNDWYITEMLVKKYIPDSSTTRVFTNSAWDYAPEAAPIDTVAPRVTPGPLPDFAPTAGLTLGWSTSDDRPDSDPITFLQYQRNSNWYGIGAYSLPTESYNFKGTAGETYEFRFYASDSAGNVSQIPRQGTKPVTFYDWAVNGRYTDVRGAPVPGVVHPDTAKCLNKGPTFPSDPTGTLDCYMKENSNTFSPQKSGYEKIASTTLDKKQAGPYEWVFPPGDNLTANGNFEEALSILNSNDQTSTLPGWDVTGVLSPVQTASRRVYGTNSAMFGQANPVGEIELITGAKAGAGIPEVVKDSSGELHMVWAVYDAGVYYSHRPVGGSWSIPEFIYNGQVGESLRAAELAITPDDRLHVIWVSTTWVGNEYFQTIKNSTRSSGQSWSTPVDVISGIKIYNMDIGNKPLLAADGLGGLHVTWPDMGGVMIVHRAEGGAWSAPEQLSGILCDSVDTAATQDGATWVIWRDFGGISLQSRNPDGTWNPIEIIPRDFPPYHIRLDIGGDGSQHVIYSDDDELFFTERANVAAPWSPAITVDVVDYHVDDTNLVSGPSGVIHLAFSQDWKIYYRTRFVDGRWSIGSIMPKQTWINPPALIPETDGSAQAVWGNTEDSYAYSVLRLPETSLGSLEQKLAIPDQATQPTLSFFVHMPSDLTDRSFVAKINGQTVFSQNLAIPGWERSWIDLSSWKGQQVTVQFLLTEGPMDTQVYVYLDEVMAGSARTPTITSVEVDADQVTIKGTNFLEGVDVWLGGVQVNVVQRVDAQTLLMTLPEGLLPGWQDIWVINPQGEEAWVKNGLFWKEVLHIPLVGKNYR